MRLLAKNVEVIRKIKNMKPEIIPTKNWNDLSNISDVMNLNDRDEACLKDLQRVLETHNLSNKFGVALLHKHFDMEIDEVLLETNDRVNKTLTTQAVHSSVINPSKVATTIWRFDEGSRYGCSYCNKDHCDPDD